MRSNYDTSLAAVLAHEGGWVCDPIDPGGATNKGITQTTYDLWRIDHGLPKQSVKCITPAEICAIYKNRYWDKLEGDRLPSGLDYAMFDFAVNSGPVRAAKYLQEIVMADVDGKIGPATLAAVSERPAAELIEALCDMRQHFLERLPTFGHFGKGWTRRVSEVRVKAKAMA
jgi:lysozyme family protein